MTTTVRVLGLLAATAALAAGIAAVPRATVIAAPTPTGLCASSGAGSDVAVTPVHRDVVVWATATITNTTAQTCDYAVMVASPGETPRDQVQGGTYDLGPWQRVTVDLIGFRYPASPQVEVIRIPSPVQ